MEVYEQARRHVRQIPNYTKEEGLSVFLHATFSLLEGAIYASFSERFTSRDSLL